MRLMSITVRSTSTRTLACTNRVPICDFRGLSVAIGDLYSPCDGKSRTAANRHIRGHQLSRRGDSNPGPHHYEICEVRSRGRMVERNLLAKSALCATLCAILRRHCQALPGGRRRAFARFRRLTHQRCGAARAGGIGPRARARRRRTRPPLRPRRRVLAPATAGASKSIRTRRTTLSRERLGE
jgi:hypothetical protein